jgi:hypothetical protein
VSLHARNTDPDTSHDAVPRHITKQALHVLYAYRFGESLLDHTAYRLVGLGRKRFAHQRCSDLRHAGLIERTGEKALTPSGNHGYVCRITPLGQEYLEASIDQLIELLLL